MKENEAEKNEALQSLDELKKTVEDNQSQITVLQEEKKERDIIVDELTQANSQLKKLSGTEKNEALQSFNELKETMEGKQNEIKNMLEEKEKLEADVEQLTETNSKLVKQSESEKKEALESLNKLKEAMEVERNGMEILLGEKKECEAVIEQLTQTNSRLVKENETEKNEALLSLDEMKKTVEGKQSQITVMQEEKKERDSTVKELTQQMHQLQSEFGVQRTKLDEQLQKAQQEAELAEQLRQELYRNC